MNCYTETCGRFSVKAMPAAAVAIIMVLAGAIVHRFLPVAQLPEVAISAFKFLALSPGLPAVLLRHRLESRFFVFRAFDQPLEVRQL